MNERYVCDHADDPRCPHQSCHHHKRHELSRLWPCDDVLAECWLNADGTETLDARCVPVEEKE